MIASELISFLCVLGLLIANPAFAAAAPDQRDLATEVKAVFQAKCAECHGPQVRKPKGEFGYVLDLKKLAADPEKVVPFKPEDSELWQLVHDEEMPPEEAKAGPLTKEQKEIIRVWIEAGAPSTPIDPSATSPTNEVAESVPAPTAEKHLLDWLGNFHVVVVHFPIALLLSAAAGEVWFACWRVRQPAPAVRFCVLLGAFSAIVAAALGWLHAASGYGVSSPFILAWHRWLGTATGAGSVILAVLSEIDSRRGVRSWWFRLLLLLVALLVAVAGYFGGRLAYGDNFFKW
ncbi:MAG: c-type cytochrome domain-containing protein [Gemmataceae bacterium]